MRQDPGSSAEDDTIPDRYMIPHANLAPKDRAVSDHATAGDARLRRDDDICTDVAVMPDMHEVVELGAPANPSYFQRPAIDS